MATMPSTNSVIILLMILLVMSAVHSSSSATLGDQMDFDLRSWLMTSSTDEDSTTSFPSECLAGSTAGECRMAEDENELKLDRTETNKRRSLAWRWYISYGALMRNRVPCSRRGASYYNCRHGASANPYRRGCSRITRCRR